MPIYTYLCTACNAHIEKRQSFSDAPLTTCDACSGELRKVIHPVGIVFKGSGWYVTDSRTVSNGSSTAKSEPTEGSSSPAETKADSQTAPSETKSEPAAKAEKATAPPAATAKAETSV